MSTNSNIEWTDTTWNPVVGCTRVSAGCDNCYAVTMTHRLEKMGQAKYAGLTVLNPRGDRHFNGTVRCVPEALALPLSWRKPRRVFVNSMSDLFHEGVPFDFIDRVFAVMALCPQHTFQVLTKRPERMVEYFNDPRRGGYIWHEATEFEPNLNDAEHAVDWAPKRSNVWLGTSCENQATADERIPHLLRCRAAVRFLSCEPLLGPIELGPVLNANLDREVELIKQQLRSGIGGASVAYVDSPIHWVIVGGESGSKARPCDVAWIRSIVEQCKAAGVPCFVKQVGSVPMMRADSLEGRRRRDHPEFEWPDDTSFSSKPGLSAEWDGRFVILNDRKGGDPAEWPEDLRVREMPEDVKCP